jgi:hypothetical protein
MPVTRHPPHRSRRAALPHRAPASGHDAQASEDACRTQSSTCDREHPALRPAPAMLDHVPLGQLPSLHLLRRSLGATLVRRLPQYSEAVRLPAPVPYGRAPWVHRPGLAITRQVRCRASRVPHLVFLHMPEVADPAGSVSALPEQRLRCGLPRVRSASAPETSAISGLHTLPVHSPVNASPTPLPTPAHDSGPVWLARPSLSGTYTLHHCAGLARRLPERCASAAAGAAFGKASASFEPNPGLPCTPIGSPHRPGGAAMGAA